jgi:hypothetical protein
LLIIATTLTLAPLHAWAGYLAALASQRRLQAERGPLVQVTIRQVLVLAGQRPDGIAQLLHQRRAG